jgi:Putative beta-barrel porin 2
VALSRGIFSPLAVSDAVPAGHCRIYAEKSISIVMRGNLPSLSSLFYATRMTSPPFIVPRTASFFVIAFLALGINAYAAGFGGGGFGSGAGRSGSFGDSTLTGGGGEEIGLGIFSRLPFRITVAVQEGYDDNIFTRGNLQQGSAFTDGSLGLEYAFGSARTQISARAGAGLVYYYDRPGSSGPDYNGFFELGLTHKFSARLSLTMSAYATYQTEPDFSLDIGINRRTGSYSYFSDHTTLNFQFTPRFSTASSYTITTLRFENSVAGGDQNRIENTIGNEFRYLILPTTTLVGEYRIQLTEYLDTDSDATTHFFLAGFDHTFNPRLNGTLRAGLQLRSFDSAETTTQTGDRISPDVETSVTYQFGARSEASWTTRYGIQEGEGSANDSVRTSFHTGLEVRYGITPRISSRLALFYEHNAFESGGGSNAGVGNNSPTENNIDAALSLRYALTRYLGIQAGYNYTQIISDQSLRGYTRNRIYGGVDFVF